MLAKETYYHEISMFDSPESNVPKQPKDGKVGVDHKAIYIGQKSNWRYPWKKISNVVFEGRDSLTITCVDGKSVECIDNTEDNFSSFRELVLKLWHKKQGKAAKAEEEERESRPLVKKRKTYGKTGRSYAKPRMSMTMMSRTDFSSDEEEDTTFGKTKPTLKEETMKEMPADDEEEEEEENEFNDGESPPGFDNSDEEDNDDDHETPAVKPNRVSGTIKRGRIQKRILDDDSDDELFHDAAALTTPASKRLVSPANALDYEQDDDEENQEPPNKQPDTMAKGNQSIKNYFTVFGAGNKPSASTKAPTTTISTMLQSPKRKSSPFAKSPLPSKSPVKVPLKQDNSEWLSKLPSTAPSVQSRSRLFGKKPTNVLDEDDIESDSSAPPLSREVKSGIYGHGDTGECNTENVEKDASTFDSPPRDSVLHPTSGVDRKRFRVKHTPAKRSSADEALSYPSTPKRMRMHRYNPLHSSIKVTAPDTILKPKSSWTGLRNLGNTCYINSSLQMLFTVPTFVSSLAGKGKDLSKSLVSVSNDVKDTRAIRAANPSIVKKAIDAVTDKFQGYQQRDAHEFLSDLVDRVHDELEEEQKEKGIETTDTTPLFPTDEYFRMNVQVCLTCDSCGYARNKEEMYRHLSIDVEDENASSFGTQGENRLPWSVQQGIDQFFAPEKREIKCEKCNDGTTATQTLQILSRPKALLLHLKRFVVAEKPRVEVTNVDSEDDTKENASELKRAPPVEMTIRKNKAPVVLDSTISLGPIVPVEADKENSQDGPMATYDVKSVAHHIGGTAWSGHYTCDAVRESESKISSPSQKKTEQWVSFDDGVTSATTADQILKSEKSQKTAYMLLYMVQE